jgi:hypothetical protein
MLSTSSSSAFPPSVIICPTQHQSIAVVAEIRCHDLVHLLELEGDGIETGHELVEPLESQLTRRLRGAAYRALLATFPWCAYYPSARSFCR